MKTSILSGILLCVLSIFAGALPKVAVLDAVLPEKMEKDIGVAIAERISEELVSSGKFMVLDRTTVNQSLKELEFQMSGIVSEAEVRKAGERLGADYVVIARVALVTGTYFITAKMIDVKTGQITAQASDDDEGKASVTLKIAQRVGAKLAGGTIEPLKITTKEDSHETTKTEKTVVVSDKPPVEPVTEKGEFFDNFDGPTLSSQWHWEHENSAMWNIKERPGFLTIHTERGDLFKTMNSANNLLLQEAGLQDFQIDTKLEFKPGVAYHQAGIIVYNDDDNYVANIFGYTIDQDEASPSKKVGFVSEKEGAANLKTGYVSSSITTIYLRIVKIGKKYSGFYSVDGINFTPTAELTNDLGATPMVGLFAYSGQADYRKPNPKGEAYFDYFRFSKPSKNEEIKDTAKKEKPVVPAIKLIVDLPLEKGEFLDIFDGPAMNNKWQWVRENPALWSLKERLGLLTIHTERGDLNNEANNNQNLVLASPEFQDFQIDSKVWFKPSVPYGQAGIIVYEDDDNYVANIFGYTLDQADDAPSKKVGLSNEKEGKAGIKGVYANFPEVYLRIVKKGKKYSGFFSIDGGTYTSLGEISNDLGSTPKVGLFAYSGREDYRKQNPMGEARFDFFRISKIK